MSDRPHFDAAIASDQRNLETQVWLAVLEVHGSVFGRLNRTMGKEFGITLAKFDVLAQLYRNPEGMTQGDLSRHLKVTGGNVTGLVRRLSNEGLITRRVSPDDRRAVVVELTEPGAERYLAARAMHDALLEEWFRDLGSSEKKQALEFLRAMAKRFNPSSRAVRP